MTELNEESAIPADPRRSGHTALRRCGARAVGGEQTGRPKTSPEPGEGDEMAADCADGNDGHCRLLGPDRASQRLRYWSEGGEIGRANLDGSDVVAGLVTTPSSSVAVDASQIYWSFGDYGSPGTISAAALTDPGSPRVLIADAGEEPHDLVVGGGHIYWIDGGGSNTSIGRAELPDGSNPEPDFIPDPSVHPTGIAVDSERIYWSEGFVEDNIDSFDFQSQTIDHDSVNATKPTAIAVGGGHIYWYNFLDSAIEGATLSAGKGTSTERSSKGCRSAPSLPTANTSTGRAAPAARSAASARAEPKPLNALSSAVSTSRPAWRLTRASHPRVRRPRPPARRDSRSTQARRRSLRACSGQVSKGTCRRQSSASRADRHSR